MKKLKKLRQKLKKKLSSVVDKLEKKLKQHSEAVWKVLATALILLAVSTCGLKSQELHESWLRSKVGAKSYRIVQPGRGMGTGFSVKAPSGESYIMTNDHVCEMAVDQLHLLVVDDAGEAIPRTILHRSEKTDLCLLEGMPGVEGLVVSDNPPDLGDKLYAVGHPRGYLTALTSGEVIMEKDIVIPQGIISIKAGDEPEEQGDITEAECSKPKNKIETVERSFFGLPIKIKYCLNVTSKAYVTTILGQPGSSGSAVVDGLGRVKAVLFAGDNYGWSILVSTRDIQDFLKKY